MFVKDVQVQNQVGLHARPATFFIQKANEFKSSIWVEKDERRVNAKSLLGVLSLGIVGGTTIRIIADGADEEQADSGFVKLVESGFAEKLHSIMKSLPSNCTAGLFSCFTERRGSNEQSKVGIPAGKGAPVAKRTRRLLDAG